MRLLRNFAKNKICSQNIEAAAAYFEEKLHKSAVSASNDLVSNSYEIIQNLRNAEN